MSDWLGPGHVENAESLRIAILFLVPTRLWATFHYFWSVRNIVADQERATGVPLSAAAAEVNA